METPDSDKTQVRFRNGDRNRDRTELPGRPSDETSVRAPVSQRGSNSSRNAVALFVGACSGIVFLGLVGGFFFYETGTIKNSLAKMSTGPDGQPKNPIMNVAKWQLGQEPAKNLDGDGAADIGWWTRTFDLPKSDAVIGYFKGQGLDVAKVVPLHYEDTKDSQSITYQVYAEVPQQLMRLEKIQWKAANPDLATFIPVLVVNDGVPPGEMWDTERATVAAEAGTKLNFSWRVVYDKNFKSVTTDRLPYDDGVYTQEQISQFRSEAQNTMAQMKAQVQQINQKVDADVQANLAQVPANPPKPGLMSSRWNHGDGSGEPTKSAERVGGGTVAGAAGGAAFGAAAGDAGMGAGIGAGVGLLGGFIYDTVSKNNDRHAYERRAAAENSERMAEWRSQIKALDKQRAQVKQDGVTEKQQLLHDLADRIAANKGHLDANAQIPVSDALQGQNTAVAPNADQPSGPVK